MDSCARTGYRRTQCTLTGEESDPPTAIPKRICVPPTSATNPSTRERSKLSPSPGPALAVAEFTITRSEKDCKDCAAADSAVNQCAGGFYRVIKLNVACVLHIAWPIDNVV